MKRFIAWSLAVLCLLLSGCGKAAPSGTADGAPWSGDWVSLGNILGVEEPGNDLSLRDNNEALSVSDMYLASWTIGEAVPYTNEEGDEVALYPVRLDTLVYGCKSGDAARETLADWSARLAATYDITDIREETRSGQDYLITAYICRSETNPYDRGIAAFGVYGKYAVSAELNCQDNFTGDEAAILADFLDGCHYAVQ